MVYDRKVKYLDYMEGMTRVRGGGFVKLEARDGTLRMELSVAGLHQTDTFARDVVLCGRGREESCGRIEIAAGRGQFGQQWRNLEDIGGTGIGYGELEGLRIPLGPGREVSCRWQPGSGAVRQRPHEAGRRAAATRAAVAAETVATRAVAETAETAATKAAVAEAAETVATKAAAEAAETAATKAAVAEAAGTAEPRAAAGAAAPEGRREARKEAGATAGIKALAGMAGDGRAAIGEEAVQRDGFGEEAEGRGVLMEEAVPLLQGEMADESGPGEKEREDVPAYVPAWEAPGDPPMRGAVQEGPEGELRGSSAEGATDVRAWIREGADMAGGKRREDEAYKAVRRQASDRKEDGGRRGGMSVEWEDHSGRRSRASMEASGREGISVDRRSQGARGRSSGGQGGTSAKAPGEPDRKTVRLMEDKWQQLWAIYPHIRPFQDAREYLSIGPSDFVLFPEASYKAVNNSFLLHGYYNYHHLLLARVEHKGEDCYYIGVPGNFYEREKQVAIMFGFESFECAQEPAQPGDFGYYMMRAQI